MSIFKSIATPIIPFKQTNVFPNFLIPIKIKNPVTVQIMSKIAPDLKGKNQSF